MSLKATEMGSQSHYILWTLKRSVHAVKRVQMKLLSFLFYFGGGSGGGGGGDIGGDGSGGRGGDSDGCGIQCCGPTHKHGCTQSGDVRSMAKSRSCFP